MQVSGKDQGLATGLVPITSQMIEPFSLPPACNLAAAYLAGAKVCALTFSQEVDSWYLSHAHAIFLSVPESLMATSSKSCDFCSKVTQWIVSPDRHPPDELGGESCNILKESAATCDMCEVIMKEKHWTKTLG
jgi:hypothetical protein